MAKNHKTAYNALVETFSAPLAVSLAHESEWDGAGTDLGPFRVARANFLLKHYPLRERGYGDAVEFLAAPAGTELTTRRRVKYSVEKVDAFSLLQEHIESSQITSRLTAAAKTSFGSIGGAEFAASIEEELSAAFRESLSTETSKTIRIEKEREVEVKVLGGAEASVHTVAYQQWGMSVRLSHIDYLKVEYQPTHHGLRVVRVKEPALLDMNSSHANFLASGKAIGEYRYWRQLGSAKTTVIALTEYDDKHINPRHVEFRPARDANAKFYDLKAFRNVPSLYKISNAAFPLKESQRRTGWTDEELLALLDLEPQETAWFWELRRHRRRRIEAAKDR